MRIAFSGSHQVGKSTLIEALAEALPAYTVIDEPYRLLEDDGHEFSDPPDASDFELQLERSLEVVRDAPTRALIDRGPLDFMAYLQALGAEVEPHDELQAALDALDLVVFVPIEEPDRIALPSHEDARLRREVHERLRALFDEHQVDVLEVHGSLEARVQQVRRAM